MKHIIILIDKMRLLKPPEGFEPIDLVTVTIVNELNETGVFKYNKLAYLVEYLFIKNFATRLSGENFIKLPHGPVIGNYKKQIYKIYNEGIYDLDIDVLCEKRKVDDDMAMKLPVRIKQADSKLVIKDCAILDFIKKVLNKYSGYSSEELEKIVYRTPPMVKFMEALRNGFKTATGSYILKDCITLKEYKTPVTLGRLEYLKHIEKYPNVRDGQYEQFYNEFKILERMRPECQ